MIDVFQSIITLEGITGFSKHERIVQGIKNAIDSKVLVKGSALPSVNQMVNSLGFARKTIVRAYTELKENGIIESRNRLGYYVTSENTNQNMKVALLLYAFHTFQEIFYNTFREHLGEDIQLDIFFHHNNIEVFESIVSTIKGRYGMYVIAPIPSPETGKILQHIPSNKLLLIDRYYNLGPDYSHITQEFEQSMYDALLNLKSVIGKYEELVLFFKENTDYPMEVLRSFQRFCETNTIKGSIHQKYKTGSLKKGCVYFTIGDTDLWSILKDVQKQGLVIGEDIGILSHNDTPVKEIISGGITTFSTDFELMAKMSADFVLERKAIQETIPSIMIRRNSL